MKHRLLIAALIALIALLPALQSLAVEFTDANGRTVSVDAPQRVVSLYNSYGDAWITSGGTLVGSIADTIEAHELPDDVQNLGSHTTPNMELLFSLEPDFVLLSADIPAHADIGALLEQAGVTCAYFSTPDWRSFMTTAQLFAQLTGRDDLYQQLTEQVQQPIEAIIAEAAQSDYYQRDTVLLLRANSTSVRAKDSASTVAGNILRDMGLINLADGESALSESLSMEAILMADPDYIFLVTGGSNTQAAMDSLRRILTDNPAWATLTAVREGRFITLDRELFHFHPNARWAESYAFMAELLSGE